MSNVEELEDIADKPHVGWTPKLITGGKGTYNTGDNWLKDLKKGAVFSCKKKGTTIDLEVYGISFKHQKTFILFNALGTGPVRAVDPKEFCNHYSLFELIEEGGQEDLRKEGGENPNDTDIRSIRPPDMANDANVEGGQPPDETSL